MARPVGLAIFSANFEPRLAAPLDARDVVQYVSDLTLLATWNKGDGNAYTYVGMLVSVISDPAPANNGVYRLIASDYTNIANWEKLGGGATPQYKTITRTVAVGDLTPDKTGTHWFIKVKYHMFIEPALPAPTFTTVLKDGTPLIYGVGWQWGGNKSGNDINLRDNVEILDLTGASYTLQYQESLLLYQPDICLTNVSALTPVKNTRITSRMHYSGYGAHYLIDGLVRNGIANYTAVYKLLYASNPVAPLFMNVSKIYSREMCLKEFAVNEALGDWVIEIFHAGWRRSHGTQSLGKKGSMTPYALATNNLWTLPFEWMGSTEKAPYAGTYYFRLRNTVTNTVTDFSRRAINMKRYGVWKPDPSGDVFIGHYQMAEIL